MKIEDREDGVFVRLLREMLEDLENFIWETVDGAVIIVEKRRNHRGIHDWAKSRLLRLHIAFQFWIENFQSV